MSFEKKVELRKLEKYWNQKASDFAHVFGQNKT